MRRFRTIAPILLSGITLAIYIPALFYLNKYSTDIDVPWQSVVNIRPGFPVTWGDPIEYWTLSENLIRYKSFSFSAYPGGPLTPESHLTPGYPFFAGVLKTAFGSYLAVSIAQIGMVALTGILIFAIGQKFLSPIPSFVAGLLYILDPSTLHHAMLLLTDIPFVFLLVLTVYVFFFRLRHTPRVSLAAGILLGATILTRPIGTYLAIPLILSYAAMHGRLLGAHKTALHILLFLAGTALVLSPWLFRNYRVFGTARISATSFQLLAWNTKLFLAQKYHISIEEAWRKMRTEHNFMVDEEQMGYLRHAEVKKQFSLRNDKVMTNIALQYIGQDPFGYAKFHLLKIIPYLFGSSLRSSFIYDHFLQKTAGPDLYSFIAAKDVIGLARNLFKGTNVLFSIERIGWFIIFMVGLIPLLYVRDATQRHILLFWCLIVYFAILSSPSTYLRYRLPAEPWMFLAAMAGMSMMKPVVQRIGVCMKRKTGENLRSASFT